MNPISSSYSSAVAADPALQTAVAAKSNGNINININEPGTAPVVQGYGLPCLKCRTYYDSNLSSCPVCHESKRVAVNAVSVPTMTPETKDSTLVEEQRKRFTQELNPEAYASTSTLPMPSPAVCALEGNHTDEPEVAEVCQSCYATLQNRADLMEAALHIDLKEAAQIVYEAVWSDPSDPTKTYQNAAQSLLGELHKRAGFSALVGQIHPLSH
jgi:hypothetical protein